MFNLEQGLITEYTGARECTVLVFPNQHIRRHVRLPFTFQNQSKPQKGSIVLIASEDSFKSYIVCTLREPIPGIYSDTTTSLSSDVQLAGARYVDLGNGGVFETLKPGEIYMQVVGSSDSIPGLTPAYIYMSHQGTIELNSEMGMERLVVGGRKTSDDHEVFAEAKNVTFQSLNEIGGLQSKITFDSSTLKISNSTVAGNNLIEIPRCELTFDLPGTVILRNTTLGIDNAKLELNVTGQVDLKNTVSSLTLGPTGAIDMLGAGPINIAGPTVSFNHGTLGVARLTDTTIANPTTDPAFWLFIQQQALIFSALPPATDPGTTTALANALKAALSVMLSTFPQSITGTISTSSGTVTAGN